MTLNDFRAFFLPYCIEKQENGKYVILNRNYKPVGFITEAIVNYGKYPASVKLIMDAKIIENISVRSHIVSDRIYLYDDETNPSRSHGNMTAYLKKIKMLAKILIE